MQCGQQGAEATLGIALHVMRSTQGLRAGSEETVLLPFRLRCNKFLQRVFVKLTLVANQRENYFRVRVTG